MSTENPSAPLIPETPASLSEMLDEIEKRYKRSLADIYNPEACENSMRDVPALVEGHRKARTRYYDSVGGDPVMMAEYDAEIAAILGAKQ